MPGGGVDVVVVVVELLATGCGASTRCLQKGFEQTLEEKSITGYKS